MGKSDKPPVKYAWSDIFTDPKWGGAACAFIERLAPTLDPSIVESVHGLLRDVMILREREADDKSFSSRQHARWIESQVSTAISALTHVSDEQVKVPLFVAQTATWLQDIQERSKKAPHRPRSRLYKLARISVEVLKAQREDTLLLLRGMGFKPGGPEPEP